MDWTEAQAGRVGAGVGKAGGTGARPPTATQRRRGRWRWARPWALLLLLLGPQLLEARGWGLQREVSAEDQRVLERYLPATVEYAVHEFNLRSQDENAYKVDTAMVFSTELQLTRTRCGKFDEDIDNCPFQGRPDVNNTVTCLFTISTEPWRTVFELLNNTCSEGLL
ncbi:Cystatin-9 [Camelus dromedarius]|uniref:Cystatin-9 isoform X2 n=4 Tax=Camelus TaxID=9836 RepID=A0A8B8RI20_CAMFR|nr:cystatin-9 isoform X2 [Camelus dromedarius]XP_031290204.1 cystatin-9-like isoform X2 [Camelus dromedarius]XP_031290206.1 cystatin-9-like isoform X2 [Camelus dromedarius]XP_031290208.1 cystatin-9-like isoform X2 [Camelus dromedarius]XP_032317601.1 cystatin-9 isoform X2 [Camelus ferus]XP_032317604.1 cystatin-9-like isoform X2 [Camelus ferus]XP_045364620.1 cystatin-9-like [Camelus bactrianus]KAB1262802.1 Cystatin-9 [Camelus dromedarius]KAB1262803.1 Cystatin-9 [Camelus dromedarius]KAB126280